MKPHGVFLNICLVAATSLLSVPALAEDVQFPFREGLLVELAALVRSMAEDDSGEKTDLQCSTSRYPVFHLTA